MSSFGSSSCAGHRPSTILNLVPSYACTVTVLQLFWLRLPILLFLLLCTGTSLTGADHIPICSYQAPNSNDILPIYFVSNDTRSINRVKRSDRQNMRIKAHYDQSVLTLPLEKLLVINETVLPKAIEYWQKALMVDRMTAPFRLARKCSSESYWKITQPNTPQVLNWCNQTCDWLTKCGDAVIPADHLSPCYACSGVRLHCKQQDHPFGPGLKHVDFVFYITALQTERCNRSRSNTIAYSAHCHKDTANDRPVSGYINLCLDSISTHPQDVSTLLSTVKHEMVHAFGFSTEHFRYFRDEYNQPRDPSIQLDKLSKHRSNKNSISETIMRTMNRTNWSVREGRISRPITLIVTPRVVEEVRRHFNCNTLEGAELEDQGGSGTALTHWEKRLFENEAMTGTHTQDPVYSRLTFALLEDSGWYSPNYSMAQPLKWGRSLGCDFAKKSCKDWMDSRRRRNESIHPFCDKVKRDPLETECTDNRDALALCNLIRYNEPLPTEYQHFDRLDNVSSDTIPFYGGSVKLADYCPYIQEFTWRLDDQMIRGSQCQYPINNPPAEKNFALEQYGNQSKCFNHGKRMWEEGSCSHVRQWQHWGSGCYQYECRDGRLHLIVANYTYTCYHRNQELDIQRMANGWLHIGSIVCPPCKEICAEVGMNCKPDLVKGTKLPVNTYYKDKLICSSSHTSAVTLYLPVILTIIIINLNYHL